MSSLFPILDLGRLAYTPAYAAQLTHHERILAARASSSAPGIILLVEHDPVITVSRRATAPAHLLASREFLATAGIDVADTDRGGDITYHGPGQLVVYPIIDLNRLNLGLHDYMRTLESAVIATLAHFHVPAQRDPDATGVWTPLPPTGILAKICAMGVRVKKWVTMHGLALNVAPDLNHFSYIVPCGLAGRPVTSLAQLLGPAAPPLDDVKSVLAESLRAQFDAAVSRAQSRRQ